MPSSKSKSSPVSAPSTGLSKPSQSAPKPPKGWSRPNLKSGGSPTSQQDRDALDVAREVSTSKNYAADFTTRAPAAALFASELEVAYAWTEELNNAEAWKDYCASQRAAAWKAALATARLLKPELDLALRHDPSLAERYPQTVAFMSVWKESAARAVATKKKNKADKAK